MSVLTEVQMSLQRKKKWCRLCLRKFDAGTANMEDLARLHVRLLKKLDRQRALYRMARDFLTPMDRIGAACEAKLTRDKISGTEMAMSLIVQATILGDLDGLPKNGGDFNEVEG